MSFQPDEQAIRREVGRRVRRFIFFFVHLVIGLLLMAALPASGAQRAVLGWFVVLWLITFPAHSLWILYQWLVDRGVQKEIARQHLLYGSPEKRKNDYLSVDRLRLADDGERADPPLEIEVNEDSEGVKRQGA